MAEPFARPYSTARWASQAEFDEGLRQHMLQVYNYMMLGLGLTGIVAYVVGTTPALYTPIFVMSRVAGWAAHVIEQAEHNRLIRPRARYTGPPERAVPALGERKEAG